MRKGRGKGEKGEEGKELKTLETMENIMNQKSPEKMFPALPTTDSDFIVVSIIRCC